MCVCACDVLMGGECGMVVWVVHGECGVHESVWMVYDECELYERV